MKSLMTRRMPGKVKFDLEVLYDTRGVGSGAKPMGKELYDTDAKDE